MLFFTSFLSSLFFEEERKEVKRGEQAQGTVGDRYEWFLNNAEYEHKIKFVKMTKI